MSSFSAASGPSEGRKCLKLKMEVQKQGRMRGFMGWLRGRPWAERRLELDIEYTTSELRYYKGEGYENCRDTIDIVGCSAETVLPSAVNGKNNGLCVTLITKEKIHLATSTPEEAEKLVKALNLSSFPITEIDKQAQKMHLNVLMKDHESVIYKYIEVSRRMKGFDEASGDGKGPGPTKTVTMEELEEWELVLEDSFPKLYTKASETRTIEEFKRDEFQRSLVMHKAEEEQQLNNSGDPRLAKQRMDAKVYDDKLEYVKEKDVRMNEFIQEMVDKYKR